MRVWSVAAAVLLSLVFVPWGPSTAAPGDDPAPCPMTFSAPGHQRFVAPGDSAIVIEFDVAAELTGRFYYAVAFASEQNDFPEAPTHEGATVARFLEDADDTLIDYASSRVFRHGFEATVAGHEVRFTEPEGADCGWLASGGLRTLPPGSYRFVVAGATEYGSEIGALLPEAAVVTSVRTVAAVGIEPDSMSCAASAEVLTPLPRSHVMAACHEPFTAPPGARAYWSLFAVDRPADDPTRQATWRTAAGDSLDVRRFVVGSGDAGDYALDVPLWLAPAGHLITSPPFSLLPADDGVAGVVAIVP